MATHLAPFPPDQMPRKDFGLHFFTFLPPQGEASTYGPNITREGKQEINLAAMSRPSKIVWDSFFTHPNISYCVNLKGGSFLDEGQAVGFPPGLTDGLRVARPPGYPNLTPSPNRIQTHPDNAILMARRFADWFEYMGFKRGNGVLMPDGNEYAGAIQFSKFGSISDGPKNQENSEEIAYKRLLMFNSHRVNSEGNLIPDPEFGDNDRLPYCFGHHTKATLRNRPASQTHGLTLGDFCKQVMLRLREECDARNLCYPMYMINDMEDMVGVGGTQTNLSYSLQQAGFDQRLPYTRFGGQLLGRWQNRSDSSGIGPNNVYDGMLNIAGEFGQTFNEPVYYDWNGSDWSEKTLLQGFRDHGIVVNGPNENQFPTSQWTSRANSNDLYPNYWFFGAQGGGVSPVDNFVNGITSDGSMSIRNIGRDWRNHVFFKKIGSLYNKIADHALYKVLYEPAKEVFPHIKCGNRGVVAVLDDKTPSYDGSNSYIKYPYISEPAGKRLLRGDFSGPACFGPWITDQSGRYGPAFYRGLESDAYTSTNFTSYHSFGQTPQEIWRNFVIHQVKACFARGNPLPVIPLITLPMDNYSYKRTGDIGYEITPADLLYVLQEHYKMGVRHWLVYNQTSIQNARDPNSSLPIEKVKISWFIDVVNNFSYWVRSYNYVPPQPPPTPTELNPVNPVGVRMKRFIVK